MWPTLYTQSTPFGELPYNTWGLMIMLAFLASAVLASRRCAAVGIDPDIMGGMVGLSAASGLAGARLLHFLMSEDRAAFFANTLVYFNLSRGGFAFYGGFLLAAGMGVLYAKRRGVDVWKFADACAPAVMIGLAVGRMGCFFAGCCHGAQFTLPDGATGLLPAGFSGGQLYVFGGFPWLGMVTHKGVGLNGVPVYPTQLWEVLAATAICGVCLASFRWRRFDGQIMATMLMLYALWRPVNESMRGDAVRGTIGLSTAQLLGIVLLGLGAMGALADVRRRPFWTGALLVGIGLAAALPGAAVMLTTSQIVSVFVGVAGLGLALAGAAHGFGPETPWVPPSIEAEEDLGSAPRL
ncbi:MAG: Phosphatidylglycerol--prolipoprotein diacylglyceryl transferase [Pseudomonadota bacterium]